MRSGACFFAIFLSMLSLVGCSSPRVERIEFAQPSAAPIVEKSQEPSEVSVSIDLKFHIGDADVHFDQMKLVDKIASRVAAKDCVFVLAYFGVTSTSSVPERYPGFDIGIRSSDGATYSQDADIGVILPLVTKWCPSGTKVEFNNVLQPGVEQRYVVVFQLPAKVLLGGAELVIPSSSEQTNFAIVKSGDSLAVVASPVGAETESEKVDQSDTGFRD